MTILHSCCCWRSVRKGSYASAAYTMVYFTITTGTLSYFLHAEAEYLAGNRSAPISDSFLEPEITQTTITFNIVVVCFSSLGILATFVLLIGLHLDKRMLLVPWIIIISASILVDCIHNVYMIILESMNFNPVTAIMFTLDFFLLCLNIYSLLCVISQYQEYKEGRGTANDDHIDRGATLRLHYSTQPTGTSCLSTLRAGAAISVAHFGAGGGGLGSYDEHQPIASTSPTGGPHTHCSIIVDNNDNTGNGFRGIYKSPLKRSTRKHVQFPDESKIIESEPTSNGNVSVAVQVTVSLVPDPENTGPWGDENSTKLPDIAPLLGPEDKKINKPD